MDYDIKEKLVFDRCGGLLAVRAAYRGLCRL